MLSLRSPDLLFYIFILSATDTGIRHIVIRVTRRGLSLSPSTTELMAKRPGDAFCFPATDQRFGLSAGFFLPESRYEYYRLAKKTTRPIKAKRRRQMTILRTSG